MKDKYTNKEIIKELKALNEKFKDCNVKVVKQSKIKYLFVGMLYVIGWSTFWISLGWFNEWHNGIGIGLSIFALAILTGVNIDDI